MKPNQLFRLFKDAGISWYDHRGPEMGAAIAYNTVFSLAPILLIAISIAGWIYGKEAASSGLLNEVRMTIGPTAADAIESTLQNVQQSGGQAGMTIVGFIILLIGASGMFVELQYALNTIWTVPGKQSSGVWGFVRDRLLSFAAVLTTGFLLLVSLVLSSWLAALAKFWTPSALPGGVHFWQLFNNLVSFAVITLLFALIFKWLPDTHVAWRDVWIGAALTSLLFTLGKYLIGLYLGQSSVASTFGAAGSLVVVLVWVYYSAQILLYGAEFTHAYAKAFGSLSHEHADAPEPMHRQAMAAAH